MIRALTSPFAPYIAGAVFLVLSGGYLWVNNLQKQNDALRASLAASEGRLATCSARVSNILEDKKSDETVTDPRLFDVPSRWLLPETDAP